MSRSLRKNWKRFWIPCAAILITVFAVAALGQRVNQSKSKGGGTYDSGTQYDTSDGGDSGGSNCPTILRKSDFPSWALSDGSYLGQNAVAVRNYAEVGQANPDDPSSTLGGTDPACDTPHVLICENERAVYCLSNNLPIANSGLTQNCRYADGDDAPLKNMIEDPNLKNPFMCGFEAGANRSPCTYFTVQSENTVKGIQDAQRVNQRILNQYLGTNTGCEGGPNSPWDNMFEKGKSWGDYYKTFHGWPAFNPDGTAGKLPCENDGTCNPPPPPTKQEPAPAPVTQTISVSCSGTNWTSNCDCGNWDNSKTQAVPAALTLCQNQCGLQQCSQAFEAVARSFPPSTFGAGSDKDAFFNDNDVKARAQNMETAIAGFESSVGGNASSMYKADPDHCFFGVIKSLEQDPHAPPSSCNINSRTPSLAKLSSFLDNVVNGGTVSSADYDNYFIPEVEELNRLANIRKDQFDASLKSSSASQGGNSGVLNYFSKNSGLTAAQVDGPLRQLLDAAQDLIYDKKSDGSGHTTADVSFAELVARDKDGQGPNPYRKYLVAGTTPFTSANVATQMTNVNRFASCFAPSQDPALAQKFQSQLQNVRTFMSMENTCHPVQKTECRAGTSKGNFCTGMPLIQPGSGRSQ